MRKTLLLVLSLLVGGIIASSMGCASEWKCPNAPKFSLGQKVVFTRAVHAWDIEQGDIAIIEDYSRADESEMNYSVRLVKNGQLFNCWSSDLLEAAPPIYSLRVGDKLAFTKNIAFIDANRGDMVTVIGFMSMGNGINGWGVRVSLDKSGLTFLTNDMDLFEAVVYPDPALAPRK